MIGDCKYFCESGPLTLIFANTQLRAMERHPLTSSLKTEQPPVKENLGFLGDFPKLQANNP